MMRSMFSGVSGLKAHQLQMDVIGNNISNVNTVGFKSSRVTFQEVYSQTLKSATGPTTTGRGGSNPHQIGLGVSIGTIDVLHTRTGAQRTDKATDLSIEGDGFFVVSDGVSNFYTRAGNFDLDRLGNLIAPGGMNVMGWRANEPTSIAPRGINLAGLSMPARQTDALAFNGNLDADSEVGDIEVYTIGIFDSLGREHKLDIEFTKTGVNQWSWSLLQGDNYTIDEADFPKEVVFNTDGSISSGDIANISLTFEDGSATNIEDLSIDLTKLTQSGGKTNLMGQQLGGYTAGTIESISIDGNGIVTGLYTNGQAQEEWRIAMAHFTNPAGLVKLGGNMFQQTTNSGEVDLGVAGEGGRGVLNPGSLEMSNVDLAKEFTDMIIAQRGFQANSRIITTSDELLQELVNLKR